MRKQVFVPKLCFASLAALNQHLQARGKALALRPHLEQRDPTIDAVPGAGREKVGTGLPHQTCDHMKLLMSRAACAIRAGALTATADPERAGAGFFAAIDSDAPEVQRICLLSDRLEALLRRISIPVAGLFPGTAAPVTPRRPKHPALPRRERRRPKPPVQKRPARMEGAA